MVFVKRSCGTKPLPVALWGTRYGSKILDPRNASINSVLNMINFADSTPQFGDSCLTVRMKKLAIPEFSWILINDHIPPSLMFLHRREFKNPWTHNDFDQKITPDNATSNNSNKTVLHYHSVGIYDVHTI